MEPNSISALPTEHPGICPVCHQPVSPQFYFCPNCGAKLHEPGLSTSFWMQTGIYAFSIILPMICYLAITKWPGIAYLRSKDEKAQVVGIVACSLLVFSSVATFYYGYVWTEEAIQQATAQVNQEMSI